MIIRGTSRLLRFSKEVTHSLTHSLTHSHYNNSVSLLLAQVAVPKGFEVREGGPAASVPGLTVVTPIPVRPDIPPLYPGNTASHPLTHIYSSHPLTPISGPNTSRTGPPYEVKWGSDGYVLLDRLNIKERSNRCYHALTLTLTHSLTHSAPPASIQLEFQLIPRLSR